MKVKLKELGSISTGNTPSKSNPKFYESKDIGFVKPDIISDNKIDSIATTMEYISDAARDKARIVKENAVFVTCIGSIGKVGIATYGELAFNQQINAIEPNENVLPKYLAYNIFSNKEKLKAIANAPVVPIINKSQFGEFEITIHESIEQQQEIVNQLDLLNDIIEKQNKRLELLDDLIKSRFVEMFGNLNNTQFDTKSIEELCVFVKDGTHQTPEYTEDKESGYRFLSSKDVTKGVIDWSKIKYIPAYLHEELYKRISPQKGDLLLAKNGTTGIAAIVDTDDIFDIYVSLALLRFNEGNNVKYLWAAINSDDTQRQFNFSLKGVGVPNLHLGEIRKTKIIVPPINLQNEFAIFVEHIDKLKVKVQKALDETQTLFDSLMQKYFG